MIVGLPGENENDIIKTIELVEKLRDYRSLIVTMYFVPIGVFKDKDWYMNENIEGVYRDLGELCLRHDLYRAEDILTKYYIKGNLKNPTTYFLKIFLKLLLRSYRIMSGLEMKTTEKIESKV